MYFSKTVTEPCLPVTRIPPCWGPLGQRSNQTTVLHLSMPRSWSSLLPQRSSPGLMTLINHVLLASVHINTNFALHFLLLDISQYLFTAAITQWEFCMEANADIFLEWTAFLYNCLHAVNVTQTKWMWFWYFGWLAGVCIFVNCFVRIW